MSNKIARIQKYLKKLHNKQCNTITSIMHDISIQIQNNRTIIESNHKDKKYLEQLGNLYELDIKLSSIIDKNVMNVMTKPILNQNDLELIGAIESYRNDISQIISTLKQSYGHAEKTKDSNLEEVIRREEKKIIGYKIIIKNNKKKLANIDNEIYKITKSEESNKPVCNEASAGEMWLDTWSRHPSVCWADASGNGQWHELNLGVGEGLPADNTSSCTQHS